MRELTKWFDAVTLALHPSDFSQVDNLQEARRQIEAAAELVSQTDPPPFSVRDNHGGSGQADAS